MRPTNIKMKIHPNLKFIEQLMFQYAHRRVDQKQLDDIYNILKEDMFHILPINMMMIKDLDRMSKSNET